MAARGTDARQDIDDPLAGALRGMSRQTRKQQAAARVAAIEAQRAARDAVTTEQRISDLETQVGHLQALTARLRDRLDTLEANTPTPGDRG